MLCPKLIPISTLCRCVSSAAMSDSWSKVVLFGDSITQRSFSYEGCWGSLVADYLQRKCDVISRGFSGYNVRWCRHVLPQVVNREMAKNIAAVTVFLGANDSNEINNARQHVPLGEYRDGLADMVEYLSSVGVSREKIILISPPAFWAEAWKIEAARRGRAVTKTNETTEKYAAQCMAVAQECGTRRVDLYSSMMRTDGWQSLLVDGLHLSAAGSRLLFTILLPHLEELTSNIPVRFPLRDEVDLDNLSSSLVPYCKRQ